MYSWEITAIDDVTCHFKLWFVQTWLKIFILVELACEVLEENVKYITKLCILKFIFV